MQGGLFDMEYSFENAVVFPYGYEFLSIVSGLYKKSLIDSTLKLVSPEGWGIVGRDAGSAFGRPDIGIQTISDLKNAILESDTLIAAPFKDTGDEKTNNLVDSMIDEGINLAKTMRKKIIDLRKMENEIYVYELNNHDFEIECPIIFINGITEQLNKLDVMIDIVNSLSTKGYKVSQIGTKHYCNILGMHAFPQFMFSSMTERQKIMTFKSFTYSIYKDENPDVMIIGIPGAAIPYNDKVDNGYGIIHYLVSMAVKADFSITCSNLDVWNFEKMNIHFTHRFGHGINCVVLTNTKINYNVQEFPDKIFYEILDYQMVEKYINTIQRVNQNIPIFNEFNEKDMESLTDLIINELSNVEYFTV